MHRAVVAAVRNDSYNRTSVRRAFQDLLERIEPGLPSLIKTGDRVLLKPFLRYGHHGVESRLVSHPEVVSSVVEALRDCGAVITIGDEGSKKLRNESAAPDTQWLHDLAGRYGASLVSFARTGARQVRGRLLFPRKYLIARAIIEADAIVSCANFQPHHTLGISGAVKNMFNAVVGKRQEHLQAMFPHPTDIARVIVDVCAIAKPTISFLDLTTVKDLGAGGINQPIGLLLAGRDPVALDAVASHAVGWDETAMPTISLGERHGLGCMDLKRIKLLGLDWPELNKVTLSKLPTAPPEGESLYSKITRFINRTVLCPKPTITKSCTNCGDCQAICPVQAIRRTPSNDLKINQAKCVRCDLCISACDHEAIEIQHVGARRVARRLTGRSVMAYTSKTSTPDIK